MNSFGNLLRLTSFGESHGVAIGGVLDGMPANIRIDLEQVQSELNRRKPGQSNITTARKEKDQVKFLSGIYESKTTGTPIAFIIKNEGQKSNDYNELADVFRPSHADYTYFAKYKHRDPRGGGRASARETAIRVVAGAIAKQLLQDIQIVAYTESIGTISMPKNLSICPKSNDIENSLYRCPDQAVNEQLDQVIPTLIRDGDSLGGTVICRIMGVPRGWGEPIYDKLSARLSYAMMSINAVRGFELGNAFELSTMKGSEANDPMSYSNGSVKHLSNNSAGILGGISNGEEIIFRLAVKPTASIKKEQQTINKNNEEITLKINGRHDPIILPRIIPIVEAMTALVLADFYLQHRSRTID